jgi:hypothetical protein
MAAGFESAREFHPALERYLKLIELDEKHRELDRMDKVRSVRRDRWIQVRLAGLREAAPPEFRAELDGVVRGKLAAAVQEGTPEALERFLGYFDGQPAAGEAWARLADAERRSRRLLQAELALLRLERTGRSRDGAGAAAALADMLRQAGLASDSAAFYSRLAGQWASVPCAQGKTGGEIIDALPADDPVRRLLKPLTEWPKGAVLIRRSLQRGQMPPVYSSPVIMFVDQGRRSPFFEDVVLEWQPQNSQKLVARDGWGNSLWEMPMTRMSRRGHYYINAAMTHAAACGHLLVISTGDRVMAIDALVPPGGTPRILWRQDFEPATVSATARRARGQMMIGGGFPRMWQMEPSSSCEAVVLSEQLLCCQRFHTLQGLDPATGDVLWTREDVRPGSVLFGDDRYVVVAPPEAPRQEGHTTAMILNAADGALLGTRPIPGAGERQAFVGRFVAVWRDENEHSALELLDPSESRAVWPARKFQLGSKITVLGNEAGVYEPNGRFVLIDLADGRTVIDAKLLPERTITDLHLFRWPQGYTLVVNGLERRVNPAAGYYAMHGMRGVPITRARVYGFDRKGNRLWEKPPVIDDQFLLTSQPSHLPLLLFVINKQERKANSIGAKLSVVGVDKRTGRLIRPKELLEAASSVRVVGDPEKRTIELQSPRDILTLTFTDQPLGPNDEAARTKTGDAIITGLQKGAEEAASGTPWGIALQLLEKAAEDGIEISVPAATPRR